MPSLEEFINNPPSESPAMDAIKELRRFTSFSEEYSAIADQLENLFNRFYEDQTDSEGYSTGACLCDMGLASSLNDQNCPCCLAGTVRKTAEVMKRERF